MQHPWPWEFAKLTEQPASHRCVMLPFGLPVTTKPQCVQLGQMLTCTATLTHCCSAVGAERCCGVTQQCRDAAVQPATGTAQHRQPLLTLLGWHCWKHSPAWAALAPPVNTQPYSQCGERGGTKHSSLHLGHQHCINCAP